MTRFLKGALAALAVASAVPDGEAAGTPTITALYAEPAGSAARLVLAMSAPMDPEVFTLTEPNRIVIDFPGFAWEAGTPDASALPFITDLRHGLFRHDRARIVMELSEPVALRRIETVGEAGEGGARLTIDLAPTSQEGFALTAGWPEGARWMPETVRRPPDGQDTVILIDPGHGGIDPGASSHGLVEKTLVLDIGRRLAAHVDAVPGLTAVMTREDDRFVPLRARLQIAREVGANVLISLHTDTVASGQAEGLSFYTLSRKGVDSAAEAFAERENRADVLAGADLSGREDDLTRVLIDLARRGTNAESIKITRHMKEHLKDNVALLKTRPHRYGNLYVLKAPDIPSVLIELGFLDNAQDRARLTEPAWQETVAARLATALEAWAAEAPPGFLKPRR